MVLSDRTIKAEIAAGRLVFEPYDESLVQPSSVDVRVDRTFRVFHNSRHPYIDVRKPMDGLTELVTVSDGEPFVLHPGEFVLGQTLERVRIPDDLVARLEGKSSLGRLGLVIHSTAGFVDPGFEGNLTLELSNLANLPITIYEGMPIGQISFMRMDEAVERPYGKAEAGSKYQGQTEPTESRFYLNFPEEGKDLGEGPGKTNGAPKTRRPAKKSPKK
jgi:dCTP deaminase